MKTKSLHSICKSSAQVSGQYCAKVVAALKNLKARLREKYELALPGRSRLVAQAVAEAEELAWATPFPHLFLPAYAEVRVNAKIESAHTYAEAA